MSLIVTRENYHINHFHSAPVVPLPFKSKGIERTRHLQHCVQSASLPGYKMEFGVWSGKTIRSIAARWPDETIWGFDSFEGLPEPWYTNDPLSPSHKKGCFDLSQQVLPVYPANVQLVKGWFDQTVPQWTAEHPGPISFLHIDCDLYSSTMTILESLNDQIKPGTVIAFDEFYPWENSTPYSLWAEGEYRALGEWIMQHDRQFRVLWHSRHQQCSIQIVR